MNKSIKIIYIAGCGRSGSTVLDIVLGNHSEIVSVGELSNVCRVWDSNTEYCSCGSIARSCKFWGSVKEKWLISMISICNVDEWKILQNKFERTRYIYNMYGGKWRTTKGFNLYALGLKAIYEAISDVSGKRFIVDSSKNALRAMALDHIDGVDLKLIHLVRDGRGVACSYRKHYKKDIVNGVQHDISGTPVWRSAFSWVISNYLAGQAVKQLGNKNSLCIRYEDFVCLTNDVLMQIGGIIGLSFENVIDAVKRGDELYVRHKISGNRVRMQKNISLKLNNEWIEILTDKDKKIFWMIAGKTAMRFGYKKNI